MTNLLRLRIAPQRWISTAAVACFMITLGACNGKLQTALNPSALPPTRLELAISAAASAPVPAGVEAPVWRQLQRELTRVLNERAAGRLRTASTLQPPLDLRFEQGLLCWTQRLVGDYDNNGEVNVSDLTGLAMVFGQTVPYVMDHDEPYLRIDGDSNGEYTIADVSPIGMHFGETISGYQLLFTADPQVAGGQQVAVLDPPTHDTGAMARTTAYSHLPVKSGYFAVAPIGVGEQANIRTDYLHVELGEPAPTPDPDPDPDPNPDPNPDPDPVPPPQPGPDPLPGVGAISGRVVDSDGNPLASTTVVMPGQGTITSNEQGYFYADNVAAAKNLTVTSTAPGYASTVGLARVDGDREHFVQLTMLANDVVQPIDAQADNIISGPSGLRAKFAAGTLVDGSGYPVAGTVNVALTAVNVADPKELRAVPGNFEAVQQNKSETILQSFGMVEISVDDGLGHECNLAPGSTAELQIPIPPERRAKAPQDMGLYSFDETSGKWIEEGRMILSPDGSFYTATVSRLSWWNCDDPFPPTTSEISVRVMDTMGNSLPDALVSLTGTSISTASEDYTSTNGTLQFTTVPYEQYELSVSVGGVFVSDSQVVTAPAGGYVNEVRFYLKPLTMLSLSWAEHPDDLDLHLLMPPQQEGGPRQHCYSGRRSVGEAEMVTDDASGYGPERILLKNFRPGIYDVYVHKTSTDSLFPLEVSKAKVALAIPGQATQRFYLMNTNPQHYVYWHAFRILVSGGTGFQVVQVNELVEEPPELAFEH